MTRPIAVRLADTLLEWIDAIVSGIKGIAPLLLGLGGGPACRSDASEAKPAAIVQEAKHDLQKPAPAPEEPKAIGQFNITFYYVIGEEEVVAKASGKPVAANDNSLATIAPDQVTLYTGSCEPIADVTPDFASQLTIQGTGKLRDGRVLNVWGRCNCGHSPCFKVTQAQWGTGGTGRPLQPFRTVAVDPKVIKLGTLLYVPLLEGRTMPGRSPWGGYVHDGCVVADDVGGGIQGNQLDLFVGRRGWFLGMSGSGGSHAWARHVPVFDGTKICERKGRKVGKRSGAI